MTGAPEHGEDPFQLRLPLFLREPEDMAFEGSELWYDLS